MICRHYYNGPGNRKYIPTVNYNQFLPSIPPEGCGYKLKALALKKLGLFIC